MQDSLNADKLLSFAFLDGFLYRLLQEAHAEGVDAAGLYAYYASRVERRLGGLLDYEAAVARYLVETFAEERSLLHVGIGAGTTTCLLAALGRRVIGLESDGRRLNLATRLRDALGTVWPLAEARYQLIGGLFPQALETEAVILAGDPVLFFTNFGATLPLAAEEEMLDAFQRHSDVIVDLRLLGKTRETVEERADLAARIVRRGFAAGLPVPAPAGPFYHHYKRKRG